jgi:hypothetical protein
MITFFEHVATKFPVAMSVRMLFEHVFSRDVINGIFARNAQEQYPLNDFFSDIVDCMGGVVGRVHRSLHAAFKQSLLKGVISVSDFYYRVNGTEPGVCAALVRETAQRLMEVLDKLQAPRPPLVPGYETRIVDGNAIGATDHRLTVLRKTRSGPLPGKSLVIFDHERDIVRYMICCEDGHAQERSLFDELLQCVFAGELWIADRNFATCKLLVGIAGKGAFFVIRRHAKLPLFDNGPWEVVYHEGKEVIQERSVSITYDGNTIFARLIKKTLEKATRDGDKEIEIVTILPAEVSAKTIADAYGIRWKIETMFSTLTTVLKCELPSLGYPRAALFAFTMAVMASNIISGMRSAIRAIHGVEAEENVSVYHLVNDLQGTARSTDLLDDIGDDTTTVAESSATNEQAYSALTKNAEMAHTETPMLTGLVPNQSNLEVDSSAKVINEATVEESLGSSPVGGEVGMLNLFFDRGQSNECSSSIVDTCMPELSMNGSNNTEASSLVSARSNESKNGGSFWHSYATMSVEEFTRKLLDVVARIDLSRYEKAKTRPRSAPRVRGSPSDPPHVSTYRLLKEQRLQLQKSA